MQNSEKGSLNVLHFSVPGEVRGQGRPRAIIRAGHAAVYETAKDRSYKGLIQHYAYEELRRMGYESPAEPDACGFSVSIAVYMRCPQSFSRKKKEAALELQIMPCRKPDLDNIAKIYLDAMNGVVYPDDRMVTSLTVMKVFSDSDKVAVTVFWR